MMKKLAVILFLLNTLLAFGQTDKALMPYVKQYNDSMSSQLSSKQLRSVYKIDFGELYGSWKVHAHHQGWHVIINPRLNEKATRKAVFKALEVAYSSPKNNHIF